MGCRDVGWVAQVGELKGKCGQQPLCGYVTWICQVTLAHHGRSMQIASPILLAGGQLHDVFGILR